MTDDSIDVIEITSGLPGPAGPAGPIGPQGPAGPEESGFYVTPEDYGAVGDATGIAGVGTDDTLALQACFDAAAVSKVWAKFRPNKQYRITDTVHARGIHIDFNGGRIVYDGLRDRVAFEIGDLAAELSFSRVNVEKIKVHSTSINWTDDNYVGVRITDTSFSHFSFDIVSNFTRGIELYTQNNHCAYNHLYTPTTGDNKYGVTLTSDALNGGTPFANENKFYGGRIACSSSSNLKGSAYGWHMRVLNGGYQGQNNNIWYSPCFEMQDAQVGDIRSPWLLDDCGGNNRIHDARVESGRGYVAYANAPTALTVKNNSFDISTSIGPTPEFFNTGLATANYVFTGPIKRVNEVSFDILQLVHSYSSEQQAAVRGGLALFNLASAAPVLFENSVTMRENSVRISTGNRALGFFVVCDGGEMFTLASECEEGFDGRLSIQLYDANDAILTNVSPNAPHLKTFSTGSPAWSANYGGHYTAQQDGASTSFQISPEVKKIRCAIAGGTANAYVKKLSLTRLGGFNNTRPLHVWNPFNHDIYLRKASDPTAGIVGRHGVGDLIHDVAGGAPWRCITAGRQAMAWTSSTAYVAGTLVLNDTNKIYKCLTAGTSAASGGPTGTATSGIIDGTVEWGYLSPKAVFARLNEEITPQMFGAVGNGTIDDTAALNAAAAACRGGPASTTSMKLVIPKGTYLATAELDFTRVRFIECIGLIKSSVAISGQAAVKIGTESNANLDMDGGDIQLNVASTLANNSTLSGVVGIRVKGAARCKFRLQATIFDIGVELNPIGGVGTQYIAFCVFEHATQTCRTGLKFNADFDGTNGWINQNTWLHCDCYDSGNALTAPTRGIHMTGDYASNNNVFEHSSIEAVETPIDIDYGSNNWFLNTRLESSGPVRFGRNASENHIQATYRNSVNGVTQVWEGERPNVIMYHDSIWLPELKVSYEDFFAIGSVVHSRKLRNDSLLTMEFPTGVLDSAARSFNPGSNGGYHNLRVTKGDVFRIVGDFVSGATVLTLSTRDAAEATLPALTAGDIPYIGANNTPGTSGTSGTGNNLDVALSHNHPFLFSVNRDEVINVRVRVRGVMRSLLIQRLVNGGRRFDAQIDKGFDLGLRVMEAYAAVDIASAAHIVNTSGKVVGKIIRDTTNNRLMMARGTTTTSPWDVIDGSASVTPV